MPNAARLQSSSAVLGGRPQLAAVIFVATAAVIFALGYYFAPQYTAAAILTHSLPPGASAAVPSTVPKSRKNLVSDDEIAALNQQLHLYPAPLMTLAMRWTTARTRGNFSLTTISDSGTLDALPDAPPEIATAVERLRIAYTGRDKDTVLRVTNALARTLSQSRLQATHEDSLSSAEAASAVSETIAPSPKTRPSLSASSEQKNASSQRNLQNSPATLNGLRRKLDQVGDRQAELETQLRKQTSALDSIQKERLRLSIASKDKIAADRERQLNKHDAAESALRSQLAAATQTMNDLGERYTPNYPEYLNAKDRVDDLQAKLNRFQSKPIVFVPEPPANNSKQLADLNQQETAIKGALQILQQELDRNQTDSRRVQKQVMHWSEANAAISPTKSPGRSKKLAPAQSVTEVSLNFRPEFTILQHAVLLSTSPRINFEGLTLISLAFGLIAACTTILVMEKPRKLVRSEEDLLSQLPAGIKYLGGIPRIKHEIIPR